MKIKRSNKKIKKLLKIANKHNGIFSGDTYEAGVLNTIDWLKGKTDYNPMSDYKSLLNKDT
jgi:hypothetical protein